MEMNEDFIWKEICDDLYADVRKLLREDYRMCRDTMPRELIAHIIEQAVVIQTLCEGSDEERQRCMERLIANRPAEREERRGRGQIGLCG
jgi:hypothetical protein